MNRPPGSRVTPRLRRASALVLCGLAAAACGTGAPTAARAPDAAPSAGAPVSAAAAEDVPPTSEPAPTTTVASRGWLTVQGVGDTNLDPSYVPNLRSHGYDFAFERLGGLFLDDDLTVVNLECSPSALGTARDKEFTFRCDPASLPVAREHGVDVANLANNHGQDFGVEAMLDGRTNVAAAGIIPVGVGADLAEAMTPALVEINGWTVAVLGMGGVVPTDSWLATTDRPGMASGDDLEQMVAAVSAADSVADLVVVSIHWGRELVTEPDAGDRARAEAMIAAGADVIFGHHSHRLGRVEFIDGRPVFWTLGNFVWPRMSQASANTAIARAVFSPDGAVVTCMIPAFIATSGRPELTGPIGCGPGDR